MTMMAVLGLQGTGKSTLSILFARIIQSHAFRTFGQYVPIYTNMNAEGDINIISDLGEIPYDKKPKILIIDEAMFTVDSRNSSSHENREWTRAVAFFRKNQHLLTIFATHEISMVDVRIKGQLSYIIMCRKNKKYFEYLMIDTVAYLTKYFVVPKTPQLFDYCDFDTTDFPNPISTDLLTELMPNIAAKSKRRPKTK